MVEDWLDRVPALELGLGDVERESSRCTKCDGGGVASDCIHMSCKRLPIRGRDPQTPVVNAFVSSRVPWSKTSTVSRLVFLGVDWLMPLYCGMSEPQSRAQQHAETILPGSLDLLRFSSDGVQLFVCQT